MSESLKALYEKKGKVWKEARDLNEKVIAEDREYTAEENETYNRLSGELSKIGDAIKRTEELNKLGEGGEYRAKPGRDDFDGKESQKRDDAGEITPEVRSLAFQGWLREQSGLNLESRHEEACKLVRLNPRSKTLDIMLARNEDYADAQRRVTAAHPQMFQRAMSGVNLSNGGSLVAPETLVSSLEMNMLAFGGMLQTSEVIRTDSGNELGWPSVDDTSSTGAQIGENVAADMTTGIATAKQKWFAYEFTSKGIQVPNSLMEDSAFNLPAIIGAMLGERLGRIANTKFTTGTGAATPEGILVGAEAATVGLTNGETASASAITADEVFSLIHSVDPAYRNNCRFMMHDHIVLALRKLKAHDSQYIWQPGLIAGVPDSLLGYPLSINQDMPSTLTNDAKVILFGQLSKYKVRQVRQVQIYRLVERYRDANQDGFVAFTRFDGKLLNAGTCPVKYLKMKA
jgi:HK97 family phage major capsid protein